LNCKNSDFFIRKTIQKVWEKTFQHWSDARGNKKRKVIFLGKCSDWKGGEGFGGSGMGEAKTDPVLGNGHDWPKLIK
jgi:hypothetical protein